MKILCLASIMMMLLSLTECGLPAIRNSIRQEQPREQDCTIKYEDEWKTTCERVFEKVCNQEPRESCTTETKTECWVENEEKCVTEPTLECETVYEKACHTEWVEECINENEEVCEELNECIEPEGPREVITDHHSYSAPPRSATPPRSSVPVAQDHSSLPSLSAHFESKSERVQNLFQKVSDGFHSKRSVAEALELLDDAEKKEMADALDVPVSKLSELSEEIADSENDHHTEEGNSRQKRGLLGLHFLKKHLIGKALVGKALIGTGTALAATGVVAPPIAASLIGAGATAAGTALIGKKLALAAGAGAATVAAGTASAGTLAAGTASAGAIAAGTAARSKSSRSSPRTVVHSSTKSHVSSGPRSIDVVEKCRNVNKCYQRPVTKCQETPVEACWDEPRESCTRGSSQRCFNEPKEVCRNYPEENCVRSVEETCWDEPREQCTEQRVKVARKWCHVEEPITGNEVW